VPLAYFAKDVFFFNSRLPFSAPSLYSPADAWALLVSSIFSTAPADPGRVTTASPLPAPPAPHLGMLPSHYCPRITPPLNPPSNRALISFNGLNRHSPPPLLRPPLRRLPGPYKSPRGPPEHFTPHRAPPFSSSAPERPPPTEFPRPPPHRRDARPPHRRSRPGAPPTELPASHCPSPAPWPAPVDTGAAGGRSYGEPSATVHDWSTVDRGSGGPRLHGPSLWGFLYKINSLNQYFQEFCKEAPVFLCN
jgi:hypothetical protein